jgi:hypothetical protein
VATAFCPASDFEKRLGAHDGTRPMRHQWAYLHEMIALGVECNCAQRLDCATLGDSDAVLEKAELSTICGDFVALAINLNEINPPQMIPFCNRLQ